MAHRNRWFTWVYRTSKWWIFPWRTVNVITRWYHLNDWDGDPDPICSTAKISPTVSPQKSFFFFLIGDLPDFGASTSQHLLIPIKMWVEQCHKPPMTGNGNHTTYKNGDDWGMVCHCFTHINWYIFTVESADQMRCWRAAVFVLNLLWASQAPLKQWKLVPGSQTWQAGKCPLTCFFLQMENHL